MTDIDNREYSHFLHKPDLGGVPSRLVLAEFSTAGNGSPARLESQLSLVRKGGRSIPGGEERGIQRFRGPIPRAPVQFRCEGSPIAGSGLTPTKRGSVLRRQAKRRVRRIIKFQVSPSAEVFSDHS